MSAHGLAARLRAELKILDGELERASAALNRFAHTQAIQELDVAALRLQLWYTGLESLLVAVLQQVDGDIPTGNSWHRDLCQQALRATTNRDSLLPSEVLPALDDARSFRHRVRNAYGVDFDPILLGNVHAQITVAWPPIRIALMQCAQDLDGF